jgi:hypothetical protein
MQSGRRTLSPPLGLSGFQARGGDRVHLPDLQIVVGSFCVLTVLLLQTNCVLPQTLPVLESDSVVDEQGVVSSALVADAVTNI